MINYGDIIGNQQDWADMVTNVEMRETPFLDWLPVSKKPVNITKRYQAEKYRTPVDNRQIDGKPVTGFLSAGDSRAELDARCHYSSKAAAISRLHQDVSDVAGIEDELAHEIDKQTTEFRGDMEAWMLDASEAVPHTPAAGSGTRAVGSWLSTSAHSVDDFNSAFRPTAASVSTTATSSLKEDTILGILQSIGTTTKSKEPLACFAGPTLKRLFNNMPLFTPASTLVGGSPTGATGIVYTKPLEGRAIDRVVERYNSDFGPVDLVLSFWNYNLTDNSTTQAYSAFFLHQSKWALAWEKKGKPQWYRKSFQGGSYEAFMEAIWMLICWNPQGEGLYAPTS
jgi:hypothetical protein